MKSLSRKKKTEEQPKDEEQPKVEKRTVSDEAAKQSVVKSDMLERRLPGEPLSVWKKRVGLTKEEPKKAKPIK